MKVQLPALPIESWHETRDTLAAYAQVLGKVRRALAPPEKHWWHASLLVNGTGLTTTPLLLDRHTIELGLNLATHNLEYRLSSGEEGAIALDGQSSQKFLAQVRELIVRSGMRLDVDASLFADDRHRPYDPQAVFRFWTALAQVAGLMRSFKAGRRHETSPIQLWPHHFDLAMAWFSGRLVSGQDPADAENADEQINFGFSTGDSGINQPYFYVTAYPQPQGWLDSALPQDAYWNTTDWNGAVLPYASLVEQTDAAERLLQYWQMAWLAGSKLMR